MNEDQILRMYDQGESLQRISRTTGICKATVRRILITHGVELRDCPRAAAIAVMQLRGLTVEQIAEALGISAKTVRAYLPYTRGTYINSDKTTNAQRIAACRARKIKKEGP